ncbi:hypothetical protein K3495_g10477 [Podosphaera aphanis]|nr:hypothetical protein K3495_g10477 [Podosphaera aphanis]
MTIIDEYLVAIAGLLKAKDGRQLQTFLRVEPPLPSEFTQLSIEVKKAFPKEIQEDVDGRNDKIDRHIEKLVPQAEDDTPESNTTCYSWPGFQVFLREYLKFWRDVDFSDLLMTHSLLSEVTYACITALSHATNGIMVLPTTVYLCSCLAKLTMTLDKRPDLTARIRKVADEGESKTLVESTAETIQRAFTVCLTERTSNRNEMIRDGRPESKIIEIYQFANMVLKLLFQCRKPQLASQIFTNILQNSPALAIYPASQRVTYLYYLGRYHFVTSHFYHAQRCLEAAFNQCSTKFVKHRRIIMIYLVCSNIILGRFPSLDLMARPEFEDVLARFKPLMHAIRSGDLISFKKALGPESCNQKWFFQKGVLLPLLGRCEMLVWRSLARRVFLLTYQFPSDPNSRKAPTLDVIDLVIAAQYCQKVLEGWQRPHDDNLLQPVENNFPTINSRSSADLRPPAEGPKKLMVQDGLIHGNIMPDFQHVEAIIASLAQQGLIYGFLSHSQGKFAIIGSKQRGGPVKAGFPNVWEMLKLRAEHEGKDVEIPGWVQKDRAQGPGGVINLSGCKPVEAE